MGPIFQHTHKPAMSKVRRDDGFSQVGEPDTSARGIQNKGGLIESKRSLDLDRDRFPVAFEFPWIDLSVGQPEANAAVDKEILRSPRLTPVFEIGQ